jgi:hypothetical protein
MDEDMPFVGLGLPIFRVDDAEGDFNQVLLPLVDNQDCLDIRQAASLDG